MNRLVVIVSLCFCLISYAALGETAVFKAGAALRVVTPYPLLPVSGGVGAPRPVNEKKGDLFARALVFEKGEVRVAIVGVDFLGWPSVLCDRVRAKVPGIPSENILIGATHTHSAPDSYGFPDMHGGTGADLEYLDWVCGEIAAAVNEAADNLEPASLKIAVREAQGKIAYNYYAPQLYDPRCGVVQPVAKTGPNAGKPIATIVNYAIHPEVLGSDVLSPDLCGPLYDRIASRGGGMALFMNSAQGGMVTADNRRPDGEDARTWDECVRIGELLADEALRIIADAPPQDDPTLYSAARIVDFPVKSKLLRGVLKHSALGNAVGEDAMLPAQLNLVNLGTAQMLTIPGEALPNIGYYLKRNMPTKHSFLLGLTNEAFGYILTRVDWNSFKRYDYITRTCMGEMTGEILIESLLALVAECPSPDGPK
ncbi:MAG TPA: hypothetical protein PKI11_04600 [Candidatus Hydrogenedentes bacterium]|nr:hypothetical protein [Candidatus Hydrogenedentota bacterium]HNT87582.1 hypothetical protein [Candidatus Hydrogenedentota bacterium]